MSLYHNGLFFVLDSIVEAQQGCVNLMLTMREYFEQLRIWVILFLTTKSENRYGSKETTPVRSQQEVLLELFSHLIQNA